MVVGLSFSDYLPAFHIETAEDPEEDESKMSSKSPMVLSVVKSVSTDNIRKYDI
jgi:hypothetical protein